MHRGWFCALVVGVLWLSASARATVLIFEDLLDAAGAPLPDWGVIDQAYGDRVTALSDGVGSYLMGNGFTPNIEVAYRTIDAANVELEPWVEHWIDDYGDLEHVAFPGENGNFAEISLIPDAGWAVRLNSFDIAGWPLLDWPSQTVVLRDGADGTLVDYSPIDIEGDAGHTAFAPSLVRSGVIKIVFGPSYDIGIDNINFDQVDPAIRPATVPEPSTLLLLAGGAALLRRRRRA